MPARSPIVFFAKNSLVKENKDIKKALGDSLGVVRVYPVKFAVANISLG
jgi:hypothetical protein